MFNPEKIVKDMLGKNYRHYDDNQYIGRNIMKKRCKYCGGYVEKLDDEKICRECNEIN